MARDCLCATAARPARPSPPFRGEARSRDQTRCRSPCENHAIAGADDPRDRLSSLLDAAGPSRQSVDVRQFVCNVSERGPVVAKERPTVVIRSVAQEVHHVFFFFLIEPAPPDFSPFPLPGAFPI